MAELTVRRLTLALSLAVASLAIPAAALADDPSPAPGSPRPATCADRFPAEGPAGVDLRLGCIAGEIVGLYTASAAEPPAPISTWAIVVAAGVATMAVIAWLFVRALGRRAGRRLAPVLAASWWVCDRCRSVNGADATRCYACGAAPSGGARMATSDRPETPQSFGSGRKG